MLRETARRLAREQCAEAEPGSTAKGAAVSVDNVDAPARCVAYIVHPYDRMKHRVRGHGTTLPAPEFEGRDA